MPDLPAHGMSSHQVTLVEVLVWWLTWAPRGTSSLPLSEQDISQSSCSTTVQPLVSSATLARPSRCSLLRPSLSLTPDLGYNIRNQPPRPRLVRCQPPGWCHYCHLSVSARALAVSAPGYLLSTTVRPPPLPRR